MNKKRFKDDIQKIDYRPQKSYLLDMEIFSASDFRHKGSQEKRRSTHKYICYMLVCITGGSCIQLLDFEPISCETGSVLFIRPGQTHSFGNDEDWDGWIIMFKPEFLQSSVAEFFEVSIRNTLGVLPKHLKLDTIELGSVVETIMQILKDTRIDAQLQDINMLIRFQLYSLLIRFSLYNRVKVSQTNVSTISLRRFELFKQLLEKNFFRNHQVAEYAKQLGFTEKSLTRSTLDATGMNAKSFIASRINLEAKRLLVHTDLTITLISEKLGFEEVTNFIKFFKRMNKQTPISFRKNYWIFSDSSEQKK